MGNDYKTFLGVPGSFFLHGWQWFFCSWAVPSGLWGHESGHVCDAPNIIFKPYRELPLYPRTEPHCRLPCQSNAKNGTLTLKWFHSITQQNAVLHFGPRLRTPRHLKLVLFTTARFPRVPHAQSRSRRCECCLVCLAVLRRH